MVLKSEVLLQELLEITRENINFVEGLKEQSNDVLNWKQDLESWSILECIEHLNRYGDFYIPEIATRISTSKHGNSEVFKSNWLGRYFSKSVSYSEQLNKMKTFKSMNPLRSSLDIKALEKFIDQQLQLIDLLNQAKDVNLDKTKTAITISKFIKLKLGDTFRVVIYHNFRHIKQAQGVLLKQNKDAILGKVNDVNDLL